MSGSEVVSGRVSRSIHPPVLHIATGSCTVLRPNARTKLASFASLTRSLLGSLRSLLGSLRSLLGPLRGLLGASRQAWRSSAEAPPIRAVTLAISSLAPLTI
jgi:hypothetical protein